jgi:WASH complex subunit CCDC53
MDDAVPIKQALVLINTFITDTTAFLNKFAVLADDRLRKVDRQVTNVEKSLLVLEGKLNSIQGLEAGAPQAPAAAPAELPPVEAPPAAPAVDAGAAQVSPPPAPVVPPPAPATDAPVAEAPAAPEPEPEVNLLLIKDDPTFTRWFTMLKVGIPLQAVKNKMQSEGYDPSVMDRPNDPSPNAMALEIREDDE